MRGADSCDTDNRGFCTAWTSAQYTYNLSIGFAAMALVSVIIGATTHSRRRRVWRAVAALVALSTVFQLVAFGIVTELWREDMYPGFENAKLATGYWLCTISWIVGVLIASGVVTTGISADQGHSWAAGNRPYQPIND